MSGRRNRICRESESITDFCTMPRLRKKFVEIIWKPTIGKKAVRSLIDLAAWFSNSSSWVKIPAAMCGKNIPMMKQIVVTTVASLTVCQKTSFTLEYCRAPKLYPAIGCIPWLRPMHIMMNMNTNLLVMPYAPIPRSPLYSLSCWLMKSVTRQAAEFMRKGPRPIAIESFATLQSRVAIPFSKWNGLLLSLKWCITIANAAVWAITVAHAAPAIPISNTKMKIGSRIVLNTTVNMVRPIAFFGFPEERIAAFSPKYRWVMTLPIRMMVIYSLA